MELVTETSSPKSRLGFGLEKVTDVGYAGIPLQFQKRLRYNLKPSQKPGRATNFSFGRSPSIERFSFLPFLPAGLNTPTEVS